MSSSTPTSISAEHVDAGPELRLLACQVSIPGMTTSKQRDQHLDRCASLVDSQLKRNQADLVVLPELSSIDYSRECFEQLALMAETERGASFECWSRIAQTHHCAVAYGFARRVENGYCICTAVVSATGELAGIYDKIHLAQFGDSMEKDYFSGAGRHLLVFEVAGFRVAPIICYDIRFPELCRELVLRHDVDVILHVGAYARDESFYSWPAFVTTRAVENQCYFLSLNRAGHHFGSSLFCQPWVDQDHPPLAFAESAEECRLLRLNKSTITTARAAFTFLGDRLTDYKLPGK